MYLSRNISIRKFYIYEQVNYYTNILKNYWKFETIIRSRSEDILSLENTARIFTLFNRSRSSTRNNQFEIKFGASSLFWPFYSRRSI